MTLRFIIFFIGLVAIQVLAVRFVAGILPIYGPFIEFVEPFVERHYGGNDGSLGPLFIWGLLVGTFVYAAVLAFIGAFLMSLPGKVFSKSSPDV